MVTVGVLDEVGHEALALQTHFSSTHHQACFVSFHRWRLIFII